MAMEEMQGSMNGRPDPNHCPLSSSTFLPPFRSAQHRRAHSDHNFRIPDGLDLVLDPFDFPSVSLDEIGSEDDLFCTYLDMEKIGSKIPDAEASAAKELAEDCRFESGGGGDEPMGGEHRHRYRNSADGSSVSNGEGGVGDVIEAKKAMDPDKLAELWTLDPKRAKRILANRKSAARSKERKAHYVVELERKVHTLQTEATTLSAQLTLFQRDTSGLNTENTELQIRLQAMERQAQLRDAMNEALKQEVERLRFATGEMVSPTEPYNLGMHQHIPLTQSPLFSHQPGTMESENPPPLPKFNHFQHQSPSNQHHQSIFNFVGAHPSNAKDPLGRCFRGLDINSHGGGPHIVKPEAPHLSGAESCSSTSTF